MVTNMITGMMTNDKDEIYSNKYDDKYIEHMAGSMKECMKTVMTNSQRTRSSPWEIKSTLWRKELVKNHKHRHCFLQIF